MRPWTVYPTTTKKPNVKIDDAGGDILIIGGTHGDEPCGWEAIVEFYRDYYDKLSKPVTFLFANPEAARQGTRYVDRDLNRAFGNQYDANEGSHEMQRADEIQTIIHNFDVVLSLHATQSTDEPFAIFGPPISEASLRLLSHIGISKAVHTPKKNQRGSLISYPNVIEVECGYQWSQKAISNAKRMICDTVAFIDGIETESPRPHNDVRIFELHEAIPKPDEEVSLKVENLRTVAENELVATTPTTKLYAPKEFAPILMSENGYSDILGYHGEEKGWLSEATLHKHNNRSNIITQIEF